MKKRIVAMMGCLLFCLIGGIISNRQQKTIELQSLNRTKEKQETIIAHINGKEYAVSPILLNPTLSQEEAMFQIEQAADDILMNHCYLGNNKKKEEITSALILKEYLQKNHVQCIWYTSPSGYIQEDGKINQLRLWTEKKQSQSIQLKVRLECEGVEKTISDQIVVKKAPFASESEAEEYIKSLILQNQKEDSEKGTVLLPKEIQGNKVVWTKKKNQNQWIFFFLGVVSCIAVMMGDRKAKTKEGERRQYQYRMQFAGLIQELAVFLLAGMSVKSSFQRIGEAMCKQKKQEFLGIQLLEMVEKIQKGENEIQAYQKFAADVDVSEYRRLMSLIVQNICKGTYQIGERMSQMAQESYDEQLRQLKIKGEKVSTKLLLPMGILLIMILLLVMIPALFMNI